MKPAYFQPNMLAVRAKRLILPLVLVALTFCAAWFIFSSQHTPGEFYLTGSLDAGHVTRSYDFSAKEPGTLNASLSWDSDQTMQLSITDEAGKVLANSKGTSPIELSVTARTGETYRLLASGTTEDQRTNFVLSAANNPTEIQADIDTE